MELGIFIPIGNNGWLISTTSDITDPYGKLMEGPAAFAMAARSGTEWAISRRGIRSWTKTAI